ncbi:Protein FAM169B, partial [Galemys pyrenaicus]
VPRGRAHGRKLVTEPPLAWGLVSRASLHSGSLTAASRLGRKLLMCLFKEVIFLLKCGDKRDARESPGYPVDILEDDPEGLREAALAYQATLREAVGSPAELFSLPTGEQVKLEASSVRLCSVHRDEPQHKVLVLVSPRDTKTGGSEPGVPVGARISLCSCAAARCSDAPLVVAAVCTSFSLTFSLVVAVYIKASWWATEDVLRTSDPARQGLMKVQSFGERIVLFILNVVIFGRLERNLDDDDMFFLPHSVKEQAKILWRDGAAVGFYTTKTKGSLYGNGTGACYLLPVFDTVFVRRSHRRQGLGLAMLRDFCQTFPEEEALGVSCPISPAMLQVCRKFLLAHPEEQARLWEVEPPGAWGQRANIWLKMQLQLSRHPDREPEGTEVHLCPVTPSVGPEVQMD